MVRCAGFSTRPAVCGVGSLSSTKEQVSPCGIAFKPRTVSFVRWIRHAMACYSWVRPPGGALCIIHCLGLDAVQWLSLRSEPGRV